MSVAGNTLRCRICEHVEPPGSSVSCLRCDGPTDVAYDLAALAAVVSPARIAAGPPSLWRYRDLLPNATTKGSPAGWTPLFQARRLSQALGIDLRLKLETANPTGSLRDRFAALAGGAADALGFETLCCVSTGNLGAAVAAEAERRGLEAIVLAPAGDPSAHDDAVRRGAQVLQLDTGYDDCRALERELAPRFPWGFVSGNLHPYTVEGAKTISFEVAEQLGWSLPDVLVSPVSTGALLAKVAQGFHELRAVGLVADELPRLVGVRGRRASAPDRAFGDLAAGAARGTGGALVAVDAADARGFAELLVETEGVSAGRAAGAGLAAVVDAVRRGRIGTGERVVLVVSAARPAPAGARREQGSPIPPRLDSLLDALGAY
jgi:threonine synthase